MFGFTPDGAGANLPAEFAPWIRSGEGSPLETGAADRLARHGQPGPISAAIQRDGFYVVRSEPIWCNTDHDGVL